MLKMENFLYGDFFLEDLIYPINITAVVAKEHKNSMSSKKSSYPSMIPSLSFSVKNKRREVDKNTPCYC